MSVVVAGTRGDAPSSDQLLYNHTWCHPHLYISTFLWCVCSVPFSCGICRNLQVDGLRISSSVACMKLFLDLRRFLGRLWPCSGCLLSFTCFSRSRWAIRQVQYTYTWTCHLHRESRLTQT